MTVYGQAIALKEKRAKQLRGFPFCISMALNLPITMLLQSWNPSELYTALLCAFLSSKEEEQILISWTRLSVHTT